jgi:hypothetical protein
VFTLRFDSLVEVLACEVLLKSGGRSFDEALKRRTFH